MMPPLAIIQARVHSTRLPNKMLLPLGGKTIIRHAWDEAVQWFGQHNVVIACPAKDVAVFDELMPFATIHGYDGDDDDVLGRLWQSARWRIGSSDTIYRLTPDDFPLDLLRERCTLAQLDEWHRTVTDPYLREHIGHLFPKRIEINERSDYEEALKRVEGR